MKKSIYILGVISLSITLLATIFKVMHLAGAGVLLIAGLGGLTFVFLPLAFAKLLKSTDDKLLKFVFTAAYISFTVDFIGMLFKILHWPGAGLFLIVGIPLPFILFLRGHTPEFLFGLFARPYNQAGTFGCAASRRRALDRWSC